MKLAQISINTEDLKVYKKKTFSKAIHLYQQKASSILYAAIIIKSNAAKTASKLSEFMQNLLLYYHAITNQVIIYLYRMRTLAIKFSEDTNEEKVFIKASDTAYANDLII